MFLGKSKSLSKERGRQEFRKLCRMQRDLVSHFHFHHLRKEERKGKVKIKFISPVNVTGERSHFYFDMTAFH